MSDSFSPYKSPGYVQPSGPTPRTGERPVAITVLGILNIVFGVFGLCGLCVSAIPFFAMQNANVRNPVIEIMKENDAYFTFTMVAMGLGFIMTIVLLAAGIGLLQMKSWGRSLSIVYSGYAIISVVVGTIVNWVWLIGPLMERAQQLPEGPEKAGAMGGAIGGMFGGCAGLIYPIVLLCFMMQSRIANALRAQNSLDR